MAEEIEDPTIPAGLVLGKKSESAIPDGLILGSPATDVKKKDSSGVGSASGSSSSATGSVPSHNSLTETQDPNSNSKRSFLDFSKVDKTVVDRETGKRVPPINALPFKPRPERAVAEPIKTLPGELRKPANETERLQAINENIGVNSFANFIEAQDTPNAKEIAASMREDNKAWLDTPVEGRIEMRKWAKDQALKEAQEKIASDTQKLNFAKAKLKAINDNTPFLQLDKAAQRTRIEQTKVLQDEIDRYDGSLVFQKVKPSVLTATVFKNNNDILSQLGSQSEEYLNKVRDQDPKAYTRLLDDAYSGNLDDDQKSEIIRGALDIRRNEVESKYNALNETGAFDRVGSYHSLLDQVNAATKKANDYAAEINISQGTPTPEQKGKYENLAAEARLLSDRLADYKGQGIENEVNAVKDVHADMKHQSEMVAASDLKYKLFEDEDKQKEVNKFVADHPVVGRIWESLKDVYNIVPKIAKTGAVIGEQIYDTAAGAITGSRDTGAYNKLSGRFSAADLFESLTARKADLKLLDENDSVNYSNVFNKTTETLSDMAALLLGGNAAGAGLKAAGVGSEVAAGAGLMLSSYAQTRPTYMKTALEAGMDAKDASRFADASALLTSSLELISPNKLIFGEEAKVGFTQEFAKYFAKDGWKYAFERSSERLFKEVIPENIQELSQNIGDKVVEYATNKVYNKNLFDTDITYAETKETVILTTLATALLTGVSNKSINREEKQNYLFQAGQNFDKFKESLDNVPIHGQNKADLEAEVGRYHKAINSMPEGLSEPIQQSVAPLLVAKLKLQNQLNRSNVDDAFKADAKEKIKRIDEVVVNLTNGKYSPGQVFITDNPVAAQVNTEQAIADGAAGDLNQALNSNNVVAPDMVFSDPSAPVSVSPVVDFYASVENSPEGNSYLKAEAQKYFADPLGFAKKKLASSQSALERNESTDKRQVWESSVNNWQAEVDRLEAIEAKPVSAENAQTEITESKITPAAVLTTQEAAPQEIQEKVKAALDPVGDNKEGEVFTPTENTWTHLTNNIGGIADMLFGGRFIGKGEDLANFTKDVSTERFNINRENGGSPYFQKGKLLGTPFQKYLIVTEGDNKFTPNINKANAASFEESQGVGVLNPEFRDKGNFEVYVRNEQDGQYYKADLNKLSPIVSESAAKVKNKLMSKNSLNEIGKAFSKRFGIKMNIVSPAEADELLNSADSKDVFFQVLDDIDIFNSTDLSATKAFVKKVFETVENDAEAKSAFRKLAVKYHPDKGGSEEVMKYLNDINEQYKDGKLSNKSNYSSFTDDIFEKYKSRAEEYVKKSSDRVKRHAQEGYGTDAYAEKVAAMNLKNETLRDLQTKYNSDITELRKERDRKFNELLKSRDRQLSDLESERKNLASRNEPFFEIQSKIYDVQSDFRDADFKLRDDTRTAEDKLRDDYFNQRNAIMDEYNNKYAYQRDSKGVRGFYDRSTKTAFLVEGAADETTAIHEIFSHPFIEAVEAENPELFKNLLAEAISDPQVLDYINSNYAQADDLTRSHEYIAAAIDLEAKSQLKNKALIDYINEFWNAVKSKLTEVFGKEVQDLNKDFKIADVVNFVLKSDQNLDLNRNTAVREFTIPVPEMGDLNVSELKNGTFNVTFDDGSVENFDADAMREEFQFDPNAETRTDADYRLTSTNDPNEVAKFYDEKLAELSDTGSKDGAIADYLPSITEDEFARFNDINNLDKFIRLNYISSSSKTQIPLDTQAQEINNLYFNGNDIVSAEDIADFIQRFPNGAESFKTPAGNEDLAAIAAKYKDLTGKNLRRDTAANLAEKYDVSLDDAVRVEQDVRNNSEKVDDFIENEISFSDGFTTADEVLDSMDKHLDDYVTDPNNEFNLYYPVFGGEVLSPEEVAEYKEKINEKRDEQTASETGDNGSIDGNVGGEIIVEENNTATGEKQTGFITDPTDNSSVLSPEEKEFLELRDESIDIDEEEIVEPENRRTIADIIRSAKVETNGKLFDAFLGIGVVAYNGAIETVALAVQAGESLASAIRKGVAYIKANSTRTDDTKIYDDLLRDLKRKGLVYNDRQAELNAGLLKATAKQAVRFITGGVNTVDDFAKAIGRPVDQQLTDAFDLAQRAIAQNPTDPRSEIDKIAAQNPNPIVPLPAQEPGETKAAYAKRIVEWKRNQVAGNPGPKTLADLNNLKKEMRAKFEAFKIGQAAGTNTANKTQADLDAENDKIRQQVVGVIDMIKKQKIFNASISGQRKLANIVKKVSEAGSNPNRLYKALDYAIKQYEHFNYESMLAEAGSYRNIIFRDYYPANQNVISQFVNLDPNDVDSSLFSSYVSTLQRVAEDKANIDYVAVTKLTADIKALATPASINTPPINSPIPVPQFVRDNTGFRESARKLFSTFRRRMLDYKKGLTKEMYNLQERALGMVGVEVNQATVTATELDRELLKNKTVSADDVDGALRGDTAAMGNLPQNIADIVAKMRAHVDRLSTMLIDMGLITPAQMATVDVNLGKYLTRSYRIYTDKTYTLDNLPTPVYNRAAEFLFKKYYPEMEDTMQGSTVDEVVDATNERVKAKIAEYFAKTENEFFQQGKIGSKDMTIFDQRKAIPEEIRALFGEISDPLTNYVHTVFKVANLAANAKFLQQIKDDYTGVYFFEENDPRRKGNHSKKIAADGSESMSPLNGMYTSPEMAEAFNKHDEATTNIAKIYMKAVGLVKAGKTVFSVVTHVKNVEGNIGFVLANGHFNVSSFNGASRAVFADLQKKDNKYFQELIQPLIDLGVIKQSISANEVRELFNPDGQAASSFINNSGVPRSGMQKLKNFANKSLKLTTDLYEAEDNLFKIYAYMNDTARYSKALYGKKFENLDPDEKVVMQEKMAELIKNTYPTFSRVPDIARIGSKYIPIMGNFVSFAAESWRVGYNLHKLAVTELRDSNPEIRKIGAKRVAGLSLYYGLKASLLKIGAAGLGGLVGLLGDDDDEKEFHDATRRFLAPWSKNSDNVIIPGENGKFSNIDMSSYDPMGNASSVLNALANEGTVGQRMGGALAELLGPFADEELTFKTLNNIYNNLDEQGKQIWLDEDDSSDKGRKATGYLLKSIEPGTLSSIKRMYKDGVGAAGVPYKKVDVDVAKQFVFKVKDNEDAYASIKKLYSQAFYNPDNDYDAKALVFEKAQEKAAYRITEMHKDFQAAITLGVPASTLKKTLKGKFNAAQIRMIVTGNIHPAKLLNRKLKKYN